VIKTILKFPLDLLTRFLNAESDWVRYGIPALVLTVVLSIAMASRSNNAGSLQTPSNPRAASLRKPAGPALVQPGAPSREQVSEAPVDSAPTQPQTEQLAAGADQTPKVVGSAAGRIALCQGVQAALPHFNQGILHKLEPVLLARKAYRGGGGPKMAAQAVDQAITDYNSGAWSEADCPSTAVLPKGLIGDVVNRRYHITKRVPQSLQFQ